MLGIGTNDSVVEENLGNGSLVCVEGPPLTVGISWGSLDDFAGPIIVDCSPCEPVTLEVTLGCPCPLSTDDEGRRRSVVDGGSSCIPLEGEGQSVGRG